jgi:hypothetical protein
MIMPWSVSAAARPGAVITTVAAMREAIGVTLRIRLPIDVWRLTLDPSQHRGLIWVNHRAPKRGRDSEAASR